MRTGRGLFLADFFQCATENLARLCYAYCAKLMNMVNYIPYISRFIREREQLTAPEQSGAPGADGAVPQCLRRRLFRESHFIIDVIGSIWYHDTDFSNFGGETVKRRRDSIRISEQKIPGKDLSALTVAGSGLYGGQAYGVLKGTF